MLKYCQERQRLGIMNSKEVNKKGLITSVLVSRRILEPRKDVDGVTDYYIIHTDIVSEREWPTTEKEYKEIFERSR